MTKDGPEPQLPPQLLRGAFFLKATGDDLWEGGERKSHEPGNLPDMT